MENQVKIGLLYSEDFEVYIHEITQLRNYVKYELNEADLPLVKQKIIPLIIHSLTNSFCEPNTINLLEIIYYLIVDHSLHQELIQNSIIQSLYILARQGKKVFDQKIIQLLSILREADEQQAYNIPKQMRYLFGVAQIMQMMGFVSYRASKIRLVYRICELKQERSYKIIQPFVTALYTTLSNEGNQTEQFIAAVEILSELIMINKIKENLIVAHILEKMIDSISIWTTKFRSVLHNILDICLALMQMNKATLVFVLHCGLLKQIPQLIESNNFEVQAQLSKILIELCEDEIIIERLFLNQIVQILIEKYNKNPMSGRYFSAFQKMFQNGGNTLIKYNTILIKFIEAFLQGILQQPNLLIQQQNFEFIYQLQQQDLYQKEIHQFFEQNEKKIKQILNQLTTQDQFIINNISEFLVMTTTQRNQ